MKDERREIEIQTENNMKKIGNAVDRQNMKEIQTDVER